jgi:mannose-6-phosphate isomerase-like protein (cupin superfamily)
MSLLLQGGCRVGEIKKGEPWESGTLRVWNQIGRESGADAISLRVLEFGRGLSPGLRNEHSDEVFYVLEGEATIFIDGWTAPVTEETGVYLRPGATLTVDNSRDEPLVVVSSRCPEPEQESRVVLPLTSPSKRATSPVRLPMVRLADRETVPTGDRWYRVLVDEEVGSTRVTQFVGAIPPGRAPDHFHHYEEVLVILRGSGRMWAGDTQAPISAGSCIYLPKGQVHCVENTGNDELRLLGVFYPAGSPAARYL